MKKKTDDFAKNLAIELFFKVIIRRFDERLFNSLVAYFDFPDISDTEQKMDDCDAYVL